jgi:hypothetical protein
MFDKEVYGTIFVSGWVDGERGEPKIGTASVAGILSPFDGTIIYLRYAFSDNPVSRQEFISLALEAMEGETRADCDYSPGYSEFTPASYSEFAQIGGHDLLRIFSSTKKCYAAILVSTKPIADLTEALGLYE